MSYRVLVDDNFHYMDESQRYTQGEYPTYEEATAVCQQIVDRSLLDVYVPGMPAEKLYFSYTMFGDDPFIVGDPGSPDDGPDFSAWDYAKARCEQRCARPPDESSHDA
jgi:hypothetical protein